LRFCGNKQAANPAKPEPRNVPGREKSFDKFWDFDKLSVLRFCGNKQAANPAKPEPAQLKRSFYCYSAVEKRKKKCKSK